MLLFLIRLLSAICAYIFLAKANIYFTTLEHFVFVGGYRSLLLFSPLIIFLFKRRSSFIIFFISSICSEAILLTSVPSLHFTFILMLSFGLSSGGYLIKRQATETAQKASFNKLALSFGSIISGFVISSVVDNQEFFIHFCSFLLFLSACLSYILSKNEINKNEKLNKEKPNIYTKILFSSVGVSIGIRVFGLFVIFPQYLLTVYDKLPTWYGFEMTVYSTLVIFSQLPAALKIKQFSFKTALVALFLSCIILSFPSLFFVQFLPGALLWSSLLALEEIFAPYIDKEASKNNCLLYKEIGMGTGAGLSVLIMRQLHSPLIIGGFAAFLTLGAILSTKYSLSRKLSSPRFS